MIEILDTSYTGSRPEVWFRWKGIDMFAYLDPGVINPVVIRGTAEGCEVSVNFDEYDKLQNELNAFMEREGDEAPVPKPKKLTKPQQELLDGLKGGGYIALTWGGPIFRHGRIKKFLKHKTVEAVLAAADVVRVDMLSKKYKIPLSAYVMAGNEGIFSETHTDIRRAVSY